MKNYIKFHIKLILILSTILQSHAQELNTNQDVNTPPPLVTNTPATPTPTPIPNLGFLRINNDKIEFNDSASYINPYSKSLNLLLFKDKLDSKIAEGLNDNIAEITPDLKIILFFNNDNFNLSTLSKIELKFNDTSIIRKDVWASSRELSQMDVDFMDFVFKFGNKISTDEKTEVEWNIDLISKIFKLSQKSNDFLYKNRENEILSSVDPKKQGTLKLKNSEVDFNSSFGFYHKKYNRLEIGLYYETITDLEIANFAKAKSFTANSSIQPLAILDITLTPNTSEISLNEITDYTLYLYKDAYGRLPINPSYNAISIKKLKASEARADIIRASGKLNKNGTYDLVISGEGSAVNSKDKYTWLLNPKGIIALED